MESIRTLFETALDADEIARMIEGLSAIPPAAQKQAVDIGLILSDFSKKAAAEYFRAAPAVLQSIDPEELAGWVGMGIQIAQQSSAAGIRFFKLAPAVFPKLTSKTLRTHFIQLGLSLAERDYNLALEYYQQAPALLAQVALSEADLTFWAEQGVALGKEDYTLAVEYFRISPSLLLLLPIGLLSKWITIGRKLSSGKILSTLQFIRTSPETFSQIPSNADRERLLDLTSEVAERHPELAAKLFSEAAAILPAFQALRLEGVLLDRTLLLARFDGELAAALFLNGPKILKEMGSAAAHFPEWVEEGLSLVKRGSSQAHGFFSFESKTAREVIDRFGSGLSLSSVSGLLKRFAEALSGRPVTIQPTTLLDQIDREKGRKGGAASPTTDGSTIYLPAHVDRFAAKELNFEWYRVATAFQAGHLEFGTFTTPKPYEIADLIESLQTKYKRRGGFSGLASFFSLFPEPALIERLFEITEGARIEYLLRLEYPGLRAALIRMRESELDRRPPLTGLTPRGAVVELLQQISIAGKTKEPVPAPLQAVLFDACRTLGAVQNPDATAAVALSMRAAAGVYLLLDVEEAIPEAPEKEMEKFEERGTEVRGEGEGGGTLAPSVRGTLDPRRVEAAKRATEAQAEALIEKLKAAGIDLATEAAAAALSASIQKGEVTRASLQEPGGLDPLAERMIADAMPREETPGGKRFRYDEWDAAQDDYRSGWCQVIERPVPPGPTGAVEEILAEYGGMIGSIQTAFQHLRPEGLKRIKGEREGDELDLDALLNSRVEARAGYPPSDRIYQARQKKERSVAVAFLVDISGSTSQQLPASPSSRPLGNPRKTGKRVLDVEKEALVLLSRAMEAVGDRFALYAFSGRGKEAVDFYLLKEFEERTGTEIDRRIGEMNGTAQNRDGAAIRHATRKLLAQPAKVKLLVLISDGKPLDDGYSGAYATADTKMALREAKRRGIHSYCITIDREGSEYLQGMYGEVAYLIIDAVETLPVKLPQIYKRLTT
ncbi:MAG: VWA domain-containing protein [Nitrospirae bacterium]|nr:VWA domain-containing protein [Candidatus Manganitrophaceae bacterium]